MAGFLSDVGFVSKRVQVAVFFLPMDTKAGKGQAVVVFFFKSFF